MLFVEIDTASAPALNELSHFDVYNLDVDTTNQRLNLDVNICLYRHFRAWLQMIQHHFEISSKFKFNCTITSHDSSFTLMGVFPVAITIQNDRSTTCRVEFIFDYVKLMSREVNMPAKPESGLQEVDPDFEEAMRELEAYLEEYRTCEIKETP